MPFFQLKQATEVAVHRHLPASSLRRVRDRRLTRMMSWAAERVPWYRRLLADSGVRPEEIRSPLDLPKIPVTRREHIQGTSDLVAEGVGTEECIVRHTGGSTGRPLAVLTRWNDMEYEAMVWLRTWLRLGLRLRDRQATVKDPEDAFHAEQRTWFQRLGWLRVAYLDLYEPPDRILDELVATKPDVLRAPPSTLEAISREMDRRPSRGGWTPRLVFTTSEQLSRCSRETLQDRFAAPVHECYGATEAGCIAWRCPECGRYHPNSDTVVLEVVDPEGNPVPDGEIGEIVVTNLFSRAMPFLRYGLGDVARVDRRHGCRHSATSFAIRDLLGRTVDRIVLPDGRAVSPYQFMPDEIEGILEYQIIQETAGEVRILVVPADDFRAERMKAACREYEQDLEDACRVDFEAVDEIPRTPGEKFRRVVSRVEDAEA